MSAAAQATPAPPTSRRLLSSSSRAAYAAAIAATLLVAAFVTWKILDRTANDGAQVVSPGAHPPGAAHRPGASAAQATPAAQASPPAASPAASAASAASASRSIEDALAQVVSGGDRDWAVQAQPQPATARIGRDAIGFTVRSARDGYVYVLMLGTRRQQPTLLFPNRLDRDNVIRAGVPLRLPRMHWQLTAGGPAGSNDFVVVVTPSPRSFDGALLDAGGGFDTVRLLQTPERAPGLLVGEPAGCRAAADVCRSYGAAAFTVREVR